MQRASLTVVIPECWTVVLTIIMVILRELSKVLVESEKAYRPEDKVVMVGQYLCGTLQDHRGMDDFLHAQFRQQPKVAPHITLYLF